MGRKFTSGEKRMLFLLLLVGIGVAYYFLFWENISRRIDSDRIILEELEITYSDYRRRISQIETLQTQLDAISHLDEDVSGSFFSGLDNQEIYMGFLHDLIEDNNLRLDNVRFFRERVELPLVPTQTDGDPDTPAVPGLPSLSDAYLHVVTATTVFYANAEYPEGLLNALDAIRDHEQMIILNDARIEEIVSMRPEENGVEVAAGFAPLVEVREFRVEAVIKFISLVRPGDAAGTLPNQVLPVPPDSDDSIADESYSSATPDPEGADMPADTPHDPIDITDDDSDGADAIDPDLGSDSDSDYET